MKTYYAARPALLSLAVRMIVPLLYLAAATVAARCVAQDQGVQVLTRGPVHEAFAAASMSGSLAGEVIARSPYEPITELPPDQRPDGDDVAWIPGYWSWDDDRNDFIWVSGVWRDLPPGRQWVPGYWATASGGSQWISGFWGDAVQAEVTYLPPPPEPLEVGPSSPQPGPGSSWAPGCWIWQQTRYDWQPGYWVVPQPQWVWSPAYYSWTPRGHVYVPGYWDHDLGHRGVIFAPVYYQQPVYARPNYYYSPAVVIDLAIIATFMFVQPRSHHYYFGDYYDRRYEDRGYYPWHSRRAAHYGDDPLYVQYRAEQLRRDRDWDIHVDDLYRHRRDHAEYRPPHTYDIQVNLMKQRRSDGRENVVIGRSLAETVESRTQPQRFTPVSADERGRIESRGRDVRKLQVERAALETSTTVTARPGNNTPNAEPARIRLPKSPVTARPVESGGRSKTPPAAPDLPVAKAPERHLPAGSTRIEVSTGARRIPVDLGDSETREPRRDSVENAPGPETAPRPNRTASPQAINPPKPRTEKQRVESKAPMPTRTQSNRTTMAPNREPMAAPAARVESKTQRAPLKASRPRSSEKREQVKPRRGPAEANANTHTNAGS